MVIRTMLLDPRFICNDRNRPTEELLSAECLQLLFAAHVGDLSKEVLRPKLVSDLLAIGLLQINEIGELCSKAMVIPRSGGADLFRLARAHSGPILDLIKSSLPQVEQKLAVIEEFATLPFSSISFFILSNVLLDNWQIEAVEQEYLKQNRPLRSGKSFYFSVMERESRTSPAFGIYGNSVMQMGNDRVCAYGSGSRTTFMEQGKSPVVIRSGSIAHLETVAKVIRRELVLALKRIDLELRDFHDKSQWSFVAYPEFFIWWYHFLYTQVTNDLAQEGLVIIPDGRTFTYIIR